MAFKIIGFFAGKVKSPYLLAALLSVVPLTEIKGSILYVASSGANIWLAALCAYLPTLFLAALEAAILPKLFRLLDKHPRCRRAAGLLTDRIAKAADKILHNSENQEKRMDRLLFGVYSFVALPLPLTGIWAGGILAAMLGLDTKRTFLALAAGNFTAGGIVLAVALLAGDYASAVLDLFCALILIFLLIPILKKAIRSRRSRVTVSRKN